MASCGAGAPHRPGGAARLPPFFMPQPGSAGRLSSVPSLPADAFPRPFPSGSTPRRPKPAEDGAENGMGSARGAAEPKAAPGAEAAPKAIRRQAAETPQNRPQSTPEKDEKRPRPSGTKKDPQCRNPALRVFVGRSGRGAAVNSWLPRSYAFRKRRRPKNGQDVCSGTRPSSRGRRTGSCAAR